MEVALDLVSVLSHGVFHFNVQFLGRNFLFETFLHLSQESRAQLQLCFP